MIRPEKRLLNLLLAIIAFYLLVQPVEPRADSFTVYRGEEEIRVLKLEVEDRVSVKFTVIGGTIDFKITDPDQDAILEVVDKGEVDYSFVCGQAGDYTLHWSNIDSSEDKMVTLNYEIQHYIFGIPQMLFLTIIIVIVCIGAVATFTLMGKPY